MKQLRLIFWLRWKYLWRSALSRRIAMFLGWIVSFFAAGVIAWGIQGLFAAAERRDVPPDVFAEYLALAFALLTIGWLYFSSLSDLFDPVRLAPYPIPPRRIFLGTALSTVIGPMPIYAGGIWLGIAWGWPASTGVMLARAALFLVLVAHFVMLSRLMRLTFLQILTSRRWRDFAVVIGALLGGGVYVGFQLLRTQTGEEKMKDALNWIGAAAERHDITAWLCWMPSTWFARAFEVQGWWSAGTAAAAVVSTAVIAWLGGKAEERLAFSEPVFSYTPKAKRANGVQRPFLRGIAGTFGRLFGDDIAAIARKETLLLLRDPTVRSRLIMSSFYVILLFVWPMISGRSVKGPTISAGASGFVLLFAEMQILLNVFGTDGTALRALAGMPVRRGRLILGKNLAHAAALLPFNLVVITVFTLVYSRRALEQGTAADAIDLRLLPADLAIHVASFLAMLGAGTLFSVFFPVPVVTPGQRIQRRDEEQGCLFTLARTIALFGVMGVVAPLALARAFFTEAAFGAAAQAGLVAGALVFGAGVYALTAWGAAKALIAREEKLIDTMARA